MGIRAWLKSSTGQPDNTGQPGSGQDLTPVDTGLQDLAPVDSGAQDCAQDDPLYIFGSLRSAKEHAEAIRRFLIETGTTNKAVYQGELKGLHAEMCEELGWVPRLWDAVGREFARLPGVKRGAVKLNGQRLTVYEVREPAETAAAVVELPVAERRRADSLKATPGAHLAFAR